jgi:hypothetical protein
MAYSAAGKRRFYSLIRKLEENQLTSIAEVAFGARGWH